MLAQTALDKPSLCRREIKSMANLRTKIPDFRGFDSSRTLILRCGILMSTGSIPVILRQSSLVRIISSREIGRT